MTEDRDWNIERVDQLEANSLIFNQYVGFIKDTLMELIQKSQLQSVITKEDIKVFEKEMKTLDAIKHLKEKGYKIIEPTKPVIEKFYSATVFDPKTKRTSCVDFNSLEKAKQWVIDKVHTGEIFVNYTRILAENEKVVSTETVRETYFWKDMK